MQDIGYTDDGVRIKFVTGKPNKYLVIYRIDGEICEPEIVTAHQIFDKMDLDDCYDITIVRLVLIKGANLTYCRFRGSWHDPKNPLKMQIEHLITEEVYDVGYGTDH